MSVCAGCGFDRKYKGVAFPVRLLCDCELMNRCNKCKAMAMCVEFSVPIKPYEPSLKDKKGVELLCSDHAPAAVSDLIEKKKPQEKPKYSDTDMEDKVICVTCKNSHKMSARINWSGTYSYCPKCKKEDVHTHAY